MKTVDLDTGAKVRILRDVRDGEKADGQIATYDGDFPLTVALNDRGDWLPFEYDYSEYEAKADLKAEYPLWSGGPHGDRFAMPIYNPRFTLPDGTKIWGAECWWEVYNESVPLEESQAQLDSQLDYLRNLSSFLESGHQKGDQNGR